MSVNHRSTLITYVAVAAVLIAAAHLADHWAYVHFVYADVYDRDWGRMLRVMGFLPFWGLAAIALVLHDRALRPAGTRGARFGRGALLFGGATLGGIAAELLKLVFRRERPYAHMGEYYFRPWSERPFYNGGLSMPSSHALVAFGAAAMLARLFPSARWVWYGLAIGCALSRVAAGAHFLSDVAVSAVVGWGIVALLWRRWGGACEPREDQRTRFRNETDSAAAPPSINAPASGHMNG